MYIHVRDRDISVSTVPRLLAGQVRDSGPVSGRDKRLLSFAERKRRSGANKNSYSKDSGGIPPVVERKGHKSDRSVSLPSDVENWWSYTSHFYMPSRNAQEEFYCRVCPCCCAR